MPLLVVSSDKLLHGEGLGDLETGMYKECFVQVVDDLLGVKLCELVVLDKRATTFPLVPPIKVSFVARYSWYALLREEGNDFKPDLLVEGGWIGGRSRRDGNSGKGAVTVLLKGDALVSTLHPSLVSPRAALRPLAFSFLDSLLTWASI